MNTEAYEWEIKVVQDRYHDFGLSFEQAEQIHRFEKERNIYIDGRPGESYFSHWEEQDYELDNFSRILSADQLVLYKQNMETNNRLYEEHLLQNDERNGKSVGYFRELAGYYKDVFIPGWIQDSAQAHILFFTGKEKIRYLRAEYRRYRELEKRKLLIAHYRHHRLFSPQLLQLTLWRRECDPLFWGYRDFRETMDMATRAVTEFLLEKYKMFPESYADFFRQKEKEWAAFSEEVKARHLGEPTERVGGWHITIPGPTAAQIDEQRIMQVLLTEAYNPNTAFNFT